MSFGQFIASRPFSRLPGIVNCEYADGSTQNRRASAIRLTNYLICRKQKFRGILNETKIKSYKFSTLLIGKVPVKNVNHRNAQRDTNSKPFKPFT